MIITSIQQGKRDKERVNIFVDGAFRFAIDVNTLVRYSLHQSSELSEELITEIITEDTVAYFYRRMLDFWGRRPRSSREIKDKLRELGIKRKVSISLDQIIEQVLEKLRQQGFSDREFTSWYVRERHRQSKYGSNKVRSELVSKGVPSDIINSVLAKSFTDEESIGIKVLQKKYGVERLSEITDFKIRNAAYRFLASRGFRAADFT